MPPPSEPTSTSPWATPEHALALITLAACVVFTFVAAQFPGYRADLAPAPAVVETDGPPIAVGDTNTPPEARESVTVTGAIEEGIMAIGGETTGYRIKTEGGETIEADLTAVMDDFEATPNRPATTWTATGVMETREYVERGDVQILKVTTLKPERKNNP